RVLDLLQTHDVRTERRDRLDDLDLLALEVLGVGRTASETAPAHRDRVALTVGVERAALDGVARCREVVEHVEARELHLPTDVLRRPGAGVLKARGLDRLGV